MNLRILYEDNHLIAFDKPAGVLTQGDHSERDNLLDMARRLIKTKYHKTGNVFLGMVHRLDRQVSGVVLFAKTSKAASRLSRQFRERSVLKLYLALVHDGPPRGNSVETAEEGWRLLTHHLAREQHRTVLSGAGDPSARESGILYLPLASRGERRLLLVRLLSGRKHQIRVQLSSIGHAIVGDELYGSPMALPEGRITLHAAHLGFMHPTKKEPLAIQSPPPDYLFSGLEETGLNGNTVMDIIDRAATKWAEVP